MLDYPVVDAHVHLCNPGKFGYGWTGALPSLARLVLPADLTQAAAPVEIDRFVFVEVDANFAYRLAEVAWVASLAESDRRLQGLVAAAPLERGAAVEEELDQLGQHTILRAIRRLIQTQPDPDFCIRPDFIAGLKLLAPRDLGFDICVIHHQLPNVIKMVAKCPEVRFVLDHIGKPAIKDGIIDPWRRHLAELAAFANVECKISGVTTEADHATWAREQLKPYIAHVIDAFGFDRIMFGGDWHFSELAGPYPDWVDVLEWAVAGSTAEEKRKLFRDNAIRFYRLDP